MKKEDVKSLIPEIESVFLKAHTEAAKNTHMQVTLYIREDDAGEICLQDLWDVACSNAFLQASDASFYPICTICYMYDSEIVGMCDSEIDMYIKDKKDVLLDRLDIHMCTVYDCYCTDGSGYDEW